MNRKQDDIRETTLESKTVDSYEGKIKWNLSRLPGEKAGECFERAVQIAQALEIDCAWIDLSGCEFDLRVVPKLAKSQPYARTGNPIYDEFKQKITELCREYESGLISLEVSNKHADAGWKRRT